METSKFPQVTTKGTTKHTPGPWEVGRYGVNDFEIQGNHRKLAVVYDYERIPAGEAIATARLIAAAPDLLEALLAVQRVCKDAYLPGPVYLSIAERHAINAALAKALGETA